MFKSSGFLGSAMTSIAVRPEVQISLGGVLGDLLAGLDDDFARLSLLAG